MSRPVQVVRPWFRLGLVTRRRQAAGWALVAIGLPLLTVGLAQVRESLHLTTVLLVYQLLLIATALVGGAWPALTGAAGAFLIANYYFTQPLHTFVIRDQDNWVALLAFLVAAGVVSLLVDVTARRTAEAQRVSAEAETLGRLARAVLQPVEPLAAILDLLCETLGPTGAALRVPDLRGGVRLVTGGPMPPANADAASEILTLDSDGGALLLAGATDPGRHRLLDAFTAQLTASIEAERLAARAAEANRLAETDRLRTALLHAVSHDLRTPLAALKASVTSLRQTDVAWRAEEEAEFLATMEEETDRLNALVGNLLDLSRLETGALTVQSRPLGLEEVVPAVVAHLCNGHPTELDLPESLPPVEADPGLLERVVANIVQNALHWSPPGRPIRIAGTAADGRVELRIIDHGVGIPVHARGELFRPFRRLGDRDSGTGVGLGLAVAQGFTHAMDGDLLVEDTPGGGLTMVVALPLAAGQAST